MFDVKDFSNWKMCDGFPEGSGRSEKRWIESDEGDVGLFKWPKIDPDTHSNTFEHISEHLAYQIGSIIGIQTAVIDIGIYDDRIGSMSYLIKKDNEELREGLWFILKQHPNFDPDSLTDIDTGKYYSIEHLFEISNQKRIMEFWIEMMLFDFLIGNSDRHQNNWAFILPVEDCNSDDIRVRPCPLYDNGSSLCCYVKESEISSYLGNDRTRFLSLVDTKSKSMIRIDGHSKRHPRHAEVAEYLIRNYKHALEVADRIIAMMNMERIEAMINCYPETIISEQRKELLIKYLTEKIGILKRIVEEG